jgi:23S rRNA pseudouridine1911/1915/1917 synthase
MALKTVKKGEAVFERVILASVETNEFEDDDYSAPLVGQPIGKPFSSALFMSPKGGHIAEIKVDFQWSGQRLDQALAGMFPDFSRSRLAALVKSGDILVDGIAATPKTKLLGGEMIQANLKPRDEDSAFTAEDVPLDVVHEDADVIVINKPPGLVVHPAAGNWTGTVLNGVLYRYPQTAHVPRAGIVHRLDKDTSGLMVVALNEAAQLSLVRQLQARTVERLYAAIARGVIHDDGTVDAPIGRHPRDRVKMAVLNVRHAGEGAHVVAGKHAVTHYRVIDQFAYHTEIECKLETGRTHQIRVHMASIGFPLEGDTVYGKGLKGLSPTLHEAVTRFGRQALHARALAFVHPRTGKTIALESEIPDDMQALIEALGEV